MKNTMKKLTALTLICITLFALTVPASAATLKDDGFMYVPTTITVSGSTMKVEGYFINYNSFPIGNLDDFTLYIYQDGDFVIEASFGDLQYFKMNGGTRYYYTFTITNVSGLNRGTYNCYACDIEADFDCTYTYWY